MTVVPWIAIVVVVALLWFRILVFEPYFTIKYAPIDIALSEVLRDHQVWDRWESRLELRNMKDVPGLRRLLAHPEDRTRWVAVAALGELRAIEARDDLVRLLINDPSAQVRCTAAGALVQIGDRSVIPALIDAVADSDLGVQMWAVDALGRFQAREAESAVRAFLKENDFPAPQDFGRRALWFLGVEKPPKDSESKAVDLAVKDVATLTGLAKQQVIENFDQEVHFYASVTISPHAPKLSADDAKVFEQIIGGMPFFLVSFSPKAEGDARYESIVDVQSSWPIVRRTLKRTMQP